MKLYNFSYSSKVGLVFFENSPSKKVIFSFEKEFFFYINLKIETMIKKIPKISSFLEEPPFFFDAWTNCGFFQKIGAIPC